MLQLVNDSAWHIPAIAVFATTLLFLVMARKLPFIVGFTIVFGWLIVVDGWTTIGAVSVLPANIRSYCALLFVIVGDWRYLLLVERYSFGKLTPLRALRSLGIPMILSAVGLPFTNRFSERTLYLLYEAGFLLVLLIILAVVRRRRRPADAAAQAFVTSATWFEIAQYSLWAAADVLLLLGLSWGMILRITANTFYYGLFVPFVWWRAPDSPGRRRNLWSVTAVAVASLLISFVALRSSATTPAPPDEAQASLALVDTGKNVGSLSLADMMGSLPVEEITAIDPYYQHQKRWKAIPIESILRKGFGREPAAMLDQDFVIRAVDGFAAYFPGRRLLEGGAYVAVQDLTPSGWEPIGPQKVSPGPFYLVWAKPTQQDLETHPRPWQMASIETIVFETRFPHVRPEGVAANSPADRGFEIFRIQCLPCHSINRSGGTVGPDLNVPRNILEYRDPAAVRAFIKNPLSFRYTVMPPHPDMTPNELDDVIAYLNTMKTQKNDKDAANARK